MEMQALHKQVGGRIRELREQKGLSQEALAGTCNLHRTYIGLIERGERSLSLATLEIIAVGLGVSAAELFSGTQQSTSRRVSPQKKNTPSLADLAAHIDTLKQILIESKLIDAERYQVKYGTVRKKM